MLLATSTDGSRRRRTRDTQPWQERERLLDTGRIHLGWICGLLYAWKADQQYPKVELLAAPVMRDPRYRDQAVYYSDIIVHRDSPYFSFDDL